MLVRMDNTLTLAMGHIPNFRSREDIGSANNHSAVFVAGDQGKGLKEEEEEETCSGLATFHEIRPAVGENSTSDASSGIASVMANEHGCLLDAGGVSRWEVAASRRPEGWTVERE